MVAPSTRTIIDDDSRPALPGHVRLQFSEIRNAWAVLAPERVYWPDEISLEILKKCDGQTGAGRIAASLAEDYNAPLAEIKTDVFAFLQEYSDRLLLRCDHDAKAPE